MKKMHGYASRSTWQSLEIPNMRTKTAVSNRMEL
jgi:hypothetical protein